MIPIPAKTSNPSEDLGCPASKLPYNYADYFIRNESVESKTLSDRVLATLYPGGNSTETEGTTLEYRLGLEFLI